MNFVGHHYHWLITDYMVLSSDVEYTCVFPVAGAPPVWTAWDLQVETGNQKHLAWTEFVGMRKTLFLFTLKVKVMISKDPYFICDTQDIISRVWFPFEGDCLVRQVCDRDWTHRLCSQIWFRTLVICLWVCNIASEDTSNHLIRIAMRFRSMP